LTRTIQPFAGSVGIKTYKKEVEENILNVNISDANIRDILSVFDSLNKLYETLSRLDYAIKRKIIEKSLIEKGQEGVF